MTSAGCYACGGAITSREHVPPKCLFPKDGSVRSRSLRKDLITVPSCDEHNSEKSKDDEFLMVCLAGVVGNNSIGYDLHSGKVTRALRRNAGALLTRVTRGSRRLRLEKEPNDFLDVLLLKPEMSRLIGCFESIVRGLHFHDRGEPLRAKLKTHLGHLIHNEDNPREFARFIRDKTEAELAHRDQLGSNPEVFYYQTSEPDQLGLYLYHLRFFEGVSVYVAVQPEGIGDVRHLGFELMNLGVRTTFTLGDERYEFNVSSEAERDNDEVND